MASNPRKVGSSARKTELARPEGFGRERTTGDLVDSYAQSVRLTIPKVAACAASGSLSLQWVPSQRCALLGCRDPPGAR